MAEDLEATGPVEVDESPQRRRVWRGPWRSVALPLVVVGAIAGAIWWLDYRPDSDPSPYDARYGPVEMPAALVPAGMAVEAKKGSLAPDFLLATLDGGDLRLSDLRGKGVIVNFWATWCAPCRKEMPQFVAAYDRYKGEGLEVVAVNVQESPSIIRPFAADFGMKFPVVLDKRSSVSDSYRLSGLPMTYFIDREGVIRSVFQGPFLEQLRGTQVQGAIEEDELTRRIQEILG
ncbi:MAG: redoxin domain-containing protein [Dehalococcoidia bacterium]|nr:redoxin domain-containing protein [Dehalococcoidia bacterium]